MTIKLTKTQEQNAKRALVHWQLQREKQRAHPTNQEGYAFWALSALGTKRFGH